MAEHFDNHDILSQNTTQDNVIKMLFTHKQIVGNIWTDWRMQII